MTVSGSGDIGDQVVALAILEQLPGGPHTIVMRDGRNPRGWKHLRPFVAPLVEAQPYVCALELFNGQQVDWVSEDFRLGYHRPTRTLVDSHWAHGKEALESTLTIRGETQWLYNVAPSLESSGRIVVTRSPRYRNPAFPWHKVVGHYGRRLMFIGLPGEHADFQSQFGPVEYQPVRDLMHMAQLIAGSLLFISNQTAAFAVAEGLKHPRIQETSTLVPDCIYPGATGAQYVADGAVHLPGFGQRDLHLPSQVLTEGNIRDDRPPPGGWRYDCGAHGTMTHYNLDTLAANAARAMKADKATIRREVLVQALRQHRAHFMAQCDLSPYRTVLEALRNAGITKHSLLDFAGQSNQAHTQK